MGEQEEPGGEESGELGGDGVAGDAGRSKYCVQVRSSNGVWTMSGDHLRKLGVVKKGSETMGAWGCTMIQFWLLFVVVGLVL